MKKIYLLLSLCILFLSLYANSQNQRIVKIGAFNYYPAIFLDNDNVVKGFFVDAFKEIEKQENIKFEYIYGSWNENLERIKKGEIDLITSAAITPERQLFMDYCQTSALTVWGELYVPLESEIDGITQLEGKKIAIMKSDYNAIYFMNLIIKFGIKSIFVEVSSFEEVFKAISSKEVDAGVVNCTYGLAKSKEFNIRSTAIVFNPFDIYFATTKGKNAELLKIVDKYLNNWKHQENSVYNEARVKWTHGKTNIVWIFPKWLSISFYTLIFMSLIAFLFVFILRKQVKKATKVILEREKVLKESEAKFRSYIDSSPEGVFLTDENGKYLEVNKAASKITGYTENELLDLSIYDLVNPEKADKDATIFSELKVKGQVFAEFQYIHKNGTNRWWALVGVKLSEKRFLGFTRDITERKITENELIKLSRAIQQSPVSIIITDLNGIIEYVNPKTCELTQYSEDELIGSNPSILKSGKLDNEVYKNLWETISSGNEWFGEFQNKKKNGELFWEVASISSIYNKNGERTKYLAIKTDITEKKAFIQELEIAKTKAEASDRLKTEFMNNISHEIRTPLNGILGFAQLIADSETSDSDKLKYIEVLENSSNRLVNTITNYIDISSIVSGNMTINKDTFDIIQLLQEIYNENIKNTLSKQINFNLKQINNKNKIYIFSDKILLKKAINHLIDNSIKFTKQGYIEFGININNLDIEIFVNDSGIGISPNKINKIISPFEQGDSYGKRNYEGSGLGLSITNGIIKELDGYLIIDSELNNGCKVKIQIKDIIKTQFELKDPKINLQLNKDYLVLIAEDNQDNYLYLNTILIKQGFKTLHAINGKEVIEIYNNNPNINLILMDLKMPLMDGYQAIMQLKRYINPPYIIAVTAYAMSGDEHKAKQAGCDDYIEKPINKEKLIIKLNQFRLLN